MANRKTAGTRTAKKPLWRRPLFWCMIVLVLVALSTNNKNTDKTRDANQATAITAVATEAATKEPVIEYDALQTLFIDISFDTTEADIVKAIEDNRLERTIKEYRGSKSKEYTIGYVYTTGRNPIKGDKLEVTFDTTNGKLKTAEYFTKVIAEALLYNYGIHWELRGKKPGSMSGYYFGVAGYQKYQKVDSATEALQLAMNYEKN